MRGTHSLAILLGMFLGLGFRHLVAHGGEQVHREVLGSCVMPCVEVHHDGTVPQIVLDFLLKPLEQGGFAAAPRREQADGQRGIVHGGFAAADR